MSQLTVLYSSGKHKLTCYGHSTTDKAALTKAQEVLKMWIEGTIE
jgi:hypothetical protein